MDDLHAREDKDPLRIALLDTAGKAQQEIADLPDRSLAVAAAKLVVAQMAELRGDIENRQPGGHWTQEALTAEAALKAIEWFGLKELYDACIPEDFGRAEERA
jgi:hypothetical protein